MYGPQPQHSIDRVAKERAAPIQSLFNRSAAAVDQTMNPLYGTGRSATAD
jgi:hypothetical protein